MAYRPKEPQAFAEFSQMLAMLASKYQRANVHAGTAPAYWDELRDVLGLPIDCIMGAIRSSSYYAAFPDPSEIADRARAIAKTRNTPRGDLSRPALPETEKRTERGTDPEFDRRMAEICNAREKGIITHGQFLELVSAMIERAPKREIPVGMWGRTR